MSFYSNRIFPYILDLTIGTRKFGRYRRAALAASRGKVLEIGFGTGLNLPYYPDAVELLAAVDAERMLSARVARRIADAHFPVEIHHLDAQSRLLFADASFDTVVTTLTLCSIPDPAPALAEIARVLKPDGLYIFFEHGRSNDPRVARLQDRVNPLQRIIGAGCNLNRPIADLIRNAGFDTISLERFTLPKSPRVMAEMYRGAARRP
jgi:SAM-dependent methyltransferase